MSDDSDYIEIDCEDVIVDFSDLHMGMKDKNPMEHVRFYSKHKRNGELHYSIALGKVDAN